MSLARIGVHTGTNTTFSSTVTTAAWTSTAGNALFAVAEADVVAQNGITITGTNSASFSRVISTALAATFDLEVWVALNIPGGASQTVTAADNGGGVDSLIIVEEWSGVALTGATDKSNGATATGTTALNSGSSGTLSQAAEVIIGAGVASGNVTMTAGGSFTNLNKVNTTFSTLAFESQIVAATTAVTATMTSGTSGSNICQVATFKEASASQIKTINGLAIASVKTVNGLAIASVKTINGLTNV